MPDSTFRHIGCQMDGGVLIVTMLDAQIEGHDAAEELRKELLEASTQFPTRKWALDFRNVQFFSSAGIRPLLTLHRKVQGSVGRMAFCNLKQELLDVFLVTRLISPASSSTAPFELARDLADALGRLRRYKFTVQGDILIFTFTEENLHGDELADELTRELETVVAQAEVNKVVLDFQHVQAITTPCMRPMLHLRSQFKPRGGMVVLANLPMLVEEVLAVTRLIAPNPTTPGLFEYYADTQAAIQALSK